jgi:hypothetical protein
VARRGGEEQALADGEILVVEREGEVAALASGGLVRFIEDAEVESFALAQRWLDGLPYGLVSGEDDSHSGERCVEKLAHAMAVGRDLEVEFGLRRGDGVEIICDGAVGTNTEISERWQARLVQPFVKCLTNECEGWEKDENS